MTLGNTKIPFELKAGEDLQLRIFLDKSFIEVFVNERQAALAPHKFAPENLGITLFSNEGSMQVKEVKGWKMRSIYAEGHRADESHE
jgi:beta-fructofuranosidase